MPPPSEWTAVLQALGELVAERPSEGARGENQAAGNFRCERCVDCTACRFCEDCRACEDCTYCRECRECRRCTECTHSLDCEDCNHVEQAERCRGCRYVLLSLDCEDCVQCFACVGLRDAEFCFLNQPLSRSEYFRTVEPLRAALRAARDRPMGAAAMLPARDGPRAEPVATREVSNQPPPGAAMIGPTPRIPRRAARRGPSESTEVEPPPGPVDPPSARPSVIRGRRPLRR